jgi:hypothetical protein
VSGVRFLESTRRGGDELEGDLTTNAPTMLSRWKNWPAVAVAVGTVSLVGYLVRGPLTRWYEEKQVCEELARSESTGGAKAYDTLELGRIYYLDDSTRATWSPLGVGKYRILVTGDCFSAECQVEVRDGETSINDPSYRNIACRGGRLDLATTEFHVIGFNVPRALRRISVRILRNDQTFYEGSPGQDCPDEGFCVFPDAEWHR